MIWRRARKKDLRKIHNYLLEREYRAVTLTSRLKRQDNPVLPSRTDGSVFFCQDKTGIRGVLLFTSTGLLLPVLDLPDNGLSIRIPNFPYLRKFRRNLHSVMGLDRDVFWVKQNLKHEPEIFFNYFLMTLQHSLYIRNKKPEILKVPNLRIRTGRKEEAEKIFPLQKKYELEEVVVSKNHFSDKICLLNLKRLMRTQILVIAEINNLPVAKANTNARGFYTDQIGGVYTLESERSMGIGTLVIKELLDQVFLTKKAVSLFVKQNNRPALTIYKKLGFSTSGNYQICYYQI